MNLMIVGSGKGSWEMRGVQLGAALGARVTSQPTPDDWRWADLAILVKRAGRQFASAARAWHVPVVWDALDFWSQPAENGFGEQSARRLFETYRAEIDPVVTIGATRAMAAVCGAYLPHHSWAGLTPTPARERVSVVAYEGNPVYLGQWHRVLQDACARRGWTFVVNPPDLRAVDMLVGFRDGVWNGFMCSEWKSGVKVVNAIAAGRPFIGQSSAALSELAPPSTVVQSPFVQLDAAFDEWEPYAARAAAVEACGALAPQFTLSVVAEQYRQILAPVLEASCAA